MTTLEPNTDLTCATDSLVCPTSIAPEWTAEVGRHFLAVAADYHAVLVAAQHEIARDAKRDVALKVVTQPLDSPTLGAALANFRSQSASVAGLCAIHGREAAAKARLQTDLLEQNQMNQNEVLLSLPLDALHSRHLSPYILRLCLAITLIFEAIFNMVAFSAAHFGSRAVDYALALVTAGLFVLAAHVVGSGLRTGPIHRRNYLIAAVVALVAAAAIAGLSLLRMIAERTDQNIVEALAALHRGTPAGDLFHSRAQENHVILIAFALIAGLALVAAAAVSYLATPSHPLLQRLERLRAKRSEIQAEIHRNLVTYEAWQQHSNAMQQLLASDLDVLRALYVREFLRHRERLNRRGRIRAMVLPWVAAASACIGVFLVGDGIAHAAGTRTATYAVLVDRSGSVSLPAEQPGTKMTVTSLYRQWLDNDLIPALRPGDRVILAPISSDGGLTFHPAMDLKLPPKSGPLSFEYWFGQDDQTRRIAELLLTFRRETSNLLLSGTLTPHTCIIDSLLRLAPLLMGNPGRKVLLILTDAQESCGQLHFERYPPSLDLISSLERERKIPDLKGVHVWIGGAWAPSPYAYERLKRFWLAYFRRAGAVLPQDHFGYTLGGFSRPEN